MHREAAYVATLPHVVAFPQNGRFGGFPSSFAGGSAAWRVYDGRMKYRQSNTASGALLQLLDSVTPAVALTGGNDDGSDFIGRNGLRFCLRAYAASMLVLVKRQQDDRPFISLAALNTIRASILGREFDVARQLLERGAACGDEYHLAILAAANESDAVVERVFMSLDFTKDDLHEITSEMNRLAAWLMEMVGPTTLDGVVKETVDAIARVTQLSCG